jgi:hypothetical protein
LSTEKVCTLDIEIDRKHFIYFVDLVGDVVRLDVATCGDRTIVAPRAVTRDPKYLYFIDKDNGISRKLRGKDCPVKVARA